jgi:hypothetical protein
MDLVTLRSRPCCSHRFTRIPDPWCLVYEYEPEPTPHSPGLTVGSRSQGAPGAGGWGRLGAGGWGLGAGGGGGRRGGLVWSCWRLLAMADSRWRSLRAYTHPLPTAHSASCPALHVWYTWCLALCLVAWLQLQQQQRADFRDCALQRNPAGLERRYVFWGPGKSKSGL